MSSSRYVGRHGTVRRRFSLPSVGGSGAARAAVKSVAGVGIVLGSGAFVVAPTSAVGASDADRSALGVQQSITAADLLAERRSESSVASKASRSTERSAPAAVTAPTKGGDTSEMGALAVEPVAKPKPKPKPTKDAKDEEEAEDTATESESTESTPQTSPEPRADEADTQPEQESSSSSTASQGGSAATGNYAGQAAGLGLGPNASAVYSAVRTQFPDMTNIGGYRAGDPGDHGSGRAVDIMVTGARGDQVAAWLQQNSGSLNIKYVIWQQRIWNPGSSWESMADRGSATANHYDHVHVSVR